MPIHTIRIFFFSIRYITYQYQYDISHKKTPVLYPLHYVNIQYKEMVVTLWLPVYCHWGRKQFPLGYHKDTFVTDLWSHFTTNYRVKLCWRRNHMLTGPGVIMQDRDERMVSPPHPSFPYHSRSHSHSTHTHILSEVKISDSADLFHQWNESLAFLFQINSNHARLANIYFLDM